MHSAEQYQQLASLMKVDLEAYWESITDSPPACQQGRAAQNRYMHFYDLCSSARRGISYGWDMIGAAIWSNHDIMQAPPANLIMRSLSPQHEAQCFALFRTLFPSASSAGLVVWIFRSQESIENLVTDPHFLLAHNRRWLHEQLIPCLTRLTQLDPVGFEELPVWEQATEPALNL